MLVFLALVGAVLGDVAAALRVIKNERKVKCTDTKVAEKRKKKQIVFHYAT